MDPDPFPLRTELIRLSDLLKLAYGISGGDAKAAVQGGEVEVDGVVETRRGRKLRGGEVVAWSQEPRTVRVEPPAGGAAPAPAVEEPAAD